MSLSFVETIHHKISQFDWPHGGICAVASLDFALRGELPLRIYEQMQSIPPSQKNLGPIYLDAISQTDGKALKVEPPFSHSQARNLDVGIKLITHDLQNLDSDIQGIQRTMVVWKQLPDCHHAETLFNGPENRIGIFDTSRHDHLRTITPRQTRLELTQGINTGVLWLIHWH